MGHVKGGLGLGILSLGEGTVQTPVMGYSIPPSPDQKGYGLAGMIGAGYEWPVGRALSVGVLGRLIAGHGSGHDATGIARLDGAGRRGVN